MPSSRRGTPLVVHVSVLTPALVAVAAVDDASVVAALVEAADQGEVGNLMMTAHQLVFVADVVADAHGDAAAAAADAVAAVSVVIVAQAVEYASPPADAVDRDASVPGKGGSAVFAAVVGGGLQGIALCFFCARPLGKQLWKRSSSCQLPPYDDGQFGRRQCRVPQQWNG